MSHLAESFSLRIGVALVAALSTCAATPAAAQTPGTTKVTVRNPDLAKWAGGRNFLSSNGEFVCRALACPAPSKVTVKFSRSPTRSPDKQALANYASKVVPAGIERANANAAYSLTPGRKIERISSNASSVRGYPAIVQELRFVGGKDTVYMSKATMFVKSMLVDIASYSTTRDVARRNRDLFVNSMVVEDTPLRR
jgi:hypothetical protein